MVSKQEISAFLKQLRNTSRYTASEVATQLAKYGINISKKTIYGYESGLSMPNADTFVALCLIYDCSDPIEYFRDSSEQTNNAPSNKDKALLGSFHQLNDEGQERLLETADDMVQSGKYIKTNALELVQSE